jgi:SagB-type dehydrogenase family enzyme
MTDDLRKAPGTVFLLQTRLDRDTIRSRTRPYYGPAEPFKGYPEAPKTALPRTSWQLSEARIMKLLQRRRSIRQFAAETISLEDLAFLLWAGQGVTAQAGSHLLRTAPSAGALYPIETYVSVQRVASLAAGLYHFNVRTFELELLTEGCQGTRLAEAFLGQSFVDHAAVCLLWSAVIGRSVGKYGDRGMRYLLLDAAHICQNALLAAESLGLGGCPVAAFYDQEINQILAIDGIEETAVYGAAIGKKR